MSDGLQAIRANLHLPGLAARVGQHIEQLILDGRLQPGARLVEERVAGALGISRSSLREALIALEQSGLIVRERRNARVIRRLDKKDVRELYALWAILESEGAALACLAASPKDHAAIRSLMAAMEVASKPAEYNRLNLDFHRALVAPCPNARLVEAYHAYLKQIRWAWALAITRAGDLKASRHEHGKIMDVYVAADAEAVRRLTRAHITAGASRAGIDE